MNKTIIIINDEGEEIEHTLPGKMEVCYDCRGEGYVLRPGIREHAYSMEEFYESFDEEEAEEYFRRGGRYDVICPTCQGKNVTLEIDRELCRITPKLIEVLEKFDLQEEERYQIECEMRAEERMERLMIGDY